MGAKKRARRRSAPAIGLFLPLLVAGCFGPVAENETADPETIILPGLGLRNRLIEDEGNDSFDTPTPFPMVENQQISIDGTIHTTNDVDVYDVGQILSGDRLVVDVSATGLDAAAAVFDADGNVLYVNDDRNYFARMVNPYINFVARRDSDTAYVVVTSSPTGSSVGDYTLSLTLTPGVNPPAPNPQIVLLNFDGAVGIGFGGRSPVDIPAFDATVIAPELAGLTDELIDLVLANVREDYRGLDVDFHTSRDDGLPEGLMTVIHFGAYDPALLGVAENVDEFNQRSVQEAIVFADTFEVFNALSPTLEEYAQALANVASHEVGHLLGLIHTADTRGVMDITASLRQLMGDQVFSRSTIERSTFSIGHQDAARTLIDAVGGEWEVVQRNSMAATAEAKMAPSAGSDRFSGVPRPRFSCCVCNRCEARRLKRAAAVFD